MTNEQYEKLVELVNSIESVDKEFIDTNIFIAKFHKIFSKDYEAPTTYPWTNKPGVRDIEASKTSFYEPIKIMYDGPPEHAPFYGINYFDDCDKTNGVDKMKFTVSDDKSHSIHNAPREVCCGDQEATLRSVYSDPRNIVTVDE